MVIGVVWWLNWPGGTLAAPTSGFRDPLLRLVEVLPGPRSSSPKVRKDWSGAFRRPRRGEDVRSTPREGAPGGRLEGGWWGRDESNVIRSVPHLELNLFIVPGAGTGNSLYAPFSDSPYRKQAFSSSLRRLASCLRNRILFLLTLLLDGWGRP